MSRFLQIAALSAVMVIGGVMSAAAQSAPPVIYRSGHSFHIRACTSVQIAGLAACHAHLVTDSGGHPWRLVVAGRQVNRQSAPAISGGPYTPGQIRAAYGVTGLGSSGTTVAIVDAYAYPNAAADLATFRAQFGLGTCATSNGCLRIVNETGGATAPRSSNAGWDEEQALDLDMVSAMCPGCRIILVQANASSLLDLATAENTAAALGAHVISNSYGGGEAGSTYYESAYNHAGVAITASAGDNGYGVSFPASSPHVTAVGGTSLVWNGSTRAEYAWSGTGSGCSTVYGEPIWQQSSQPGMKNNTLCTKRMVNDVSAVADPDTGVIVYMNIPGNAPGYYIFGGTSASAQIIAGIYGENASGGAVNYGSNPYAALPSLNDVASGSDGFCGGTYFCTAESGYDGPTGLGTPKGAAGF